MDDLFLVFIHPIGRQWGSDTYHYQLLFSNEETFDGFDDDTWGIYPASGRAEAPIREFIRCVFTIKTEINLIVSQDSKFYRMYDAVDKIVPLGYEDLDGYETYPDNRLVLHYGMPYNDVSDLLSSLDITPLNITEIDD